MRYALTELIDAKLTQTVLDSLADLVGTAAAIIDTEGTILVAARWKPMCTEFHRVHQETSRLCTEGDTAIANAIEAGERFKIYRCKNGLTDAACPIFIEGEHVANAFLGQFLLEPPDEASFRKQAAKYGFDEEAYIAALRDISVVPEAKLLAGLNCLGSIAEMVGQMSLDRLRQIETATKVAQQAEEILALSTPVIQVWEGIAIAPLIGTLDTYRAQHFTEELLRRIVATSSDVVLLDITGVSVIDTQVAQHLIEAIAAVRLLGSEIILTGVKPATAQTLVHLGISLSDIKTQSSLAAGLRAALKKRTPDKIVTA